jgi:hypothetical protein
MPCFQAVAKSKLPHRRTKINKISVRKVGKKPTNAIVYKQSSKTDKNENANANTKRVEDRLQHHAP